MAEGAKEEPATHCGFAEFEVPSSKGLESVEMDVMYMFVLPVFLMATFRHPLLEQLEPTGSGPKFGILVATAEFE